MPSAGVDAEARNEVPSRTGTCSHGAVMPWSVQRVTQHDGEESWTVTDPSYNVAAPVDRFLAHLGAVDRSPGTVRSLPSICGTSSLFSSKPRYGGGTCNWRTLAASPTGCGSLPQIELDN
jgi:hypothetical protein